MVLKWLREKPEGWALRLTVNLIGAVISFIVMSMFFLTKFAQVWSILIFLPVIIFLFHRIKKHYDAVGDQLSLKTCERIVPIEGNVIVVPVAGMTHVVENSLNYAKSLSADQVIAVYVAFDREEKRNLKRNGRSGNLK